jgi:hypothetical protein
MIGTGAAILGAGLLGAGASIWGANKASDAQSNAAAQAAAVQREVLARNQANADPFISAGTGATNLLKSFYGLGGDQALGAGALERFYQSPDYQFALKGGSDALNNSLAARGGALSGNAARAATEFGQGAATQNLQNYLSRLSGMSDQGIRAAGNVAGVSTVGANNIGNSLMAGGTADAAGTLGMVKGFQSALSPLVQYNQMTQSSYGNGTGGYLPTSAGQSGSPFYGPALGG